MNKQIIFEQVKNVTAQLITKYKPEKIILYGSIPKGTSHKDSDIDILVIKDTKDHPIRRIQSVSRLIDRNIAFDFIVMTPRELDERLTLGDFFFHDILQNGKVLYEKN